METKYSVIHCDEGWFPLYEPIVKEIISFDSNMTDVKDKIGINKVYSNFGMLTFKFYHPENVPNYILEHIEKAKKESLYICESCGATKNVGYVYQTKECITCCERCFNMFIKDTLEPSAKWMERIKKK